MDRILSRSSPFGNETGKLPNGYYLPTENVFATLQQNKKVLVVGAGGLGCEILKVRLFFLLLEVCLSNAPLRHLTLLTFVELGHVGCAKHRRRR